MEHNPFLMTDQTSLLFRRNKVAAVADAASKWPTSPTKHEYYWRFAIGMNPFIGSKVRGCQTCLERTTGLQLASERLQKHGLASARWSQEQGHAPLPTERARPITRTETSQCNRLRYPTCHHGLRGGFEEHCSALTAYFTAHTHQTSSCMTTTASCEGCNCSTPEIEGRFSQRSSARLALWGEGGRGGGGQVGTGLITPLTPRKI